MAYVESQVIREIRKIIDARAHCSTTSISQEIFDLFVLLNLLNWDGIDPDPVGKNSTSSNKEEVSENGKG